MEYTFWVITFTPPPPRKKLPWRHNQTRTQREAQRPIPIEIAVHLGSVVNCQNVPCEKDCTLHQRCLSRAREELAETPLASANCLATPSHYLVLNLNKSSHISSVMWLKNRPPTAVSELKVHINLTKVLERSWKSLYFWSAQRCGNHDVTHLRMFTHKTSTQWPNILQPHFVEICLIFLLLLNFLSQIQLFLLLWI